MRRHALVDQTPRQARLEDLPEDLRCLRDFTGGYYRVLGWIDLAFSAIALGIWQWTGNLSITFSFVFWFWLGSCLKQGKPAARKWTMAIPCLMGIILALGEVFPDFDLKLTPWGMDRTHAAFIPYAISSLVIFCVPAIMLWGERGRQAFTKQNAGKHGS